MFVYCSYCSLRSVYFFLIALLKTHFSLIKYFIFQYICSPFALLITFIVFQPILGTKECWLDSRFNWLWWAAYINPESLPFLIMLNLCWINKDFVRRKFTISKRVNCWRTNYNKMKLKPDMEYIVAINRDVSECKLSGYETCLYLYFIFLFKK